MQGKRSKTAASKPAKKVTKPRRIGRPSGYSTKIAEWICERLADGQSLVEICAGKDTPTRSMVYRWMEEHETFRDRYARARQYQAESLADDIREIMAEIRAGVLDANQGRVLIDALKWLAGKFKPKVYGEHLRHSGGDGGPITVKILSFDEPEKK